ncbi:DinB superfamily metal-dependent hydrolase [Paenibacillus sp. 32O-W]|uniref:DUF1572 family protein n=1 Tax=Paenibacillus sp. 32O-W TaxID=1695218 RepID=UPI000722FFA7|nr:DUF1572 family protein [Paenibacillus sp. 32O-W]ALS26641.1 DinB superfamily metal-dependent hydrolase [Paenibacillus sp. 32O-W]
MGIGQELLTSAIGTFKSAKRLGDRTIERLSDEELNRTPASESNSIAIIVKHLHGNMISRWTDFLTTDGEKPTRQRDAEFEGEPLTKEELLRLWESGWDTLFRALEQLEESDLLRTVRIRDEAHTVIKAIQRQVSHYGYHVGQIVYIGKLIRNGQWDSLSIPKKKP